MVRSVNALRIAQRFVAALCTLLLAAGGCDRDQPPASARASTNAPAAEVSESKPGAANSPMEVVRALRAARWAHRFDDMQALVVAGQRGAVVDLVRAVDALIAAEDEFQAAVRAAVGEGSAILFRDRMQVANIIGVLSRDVDVISERVDGDTARVAIQVAGRVPLEQVELVRRDGRWQVQTDPPIPGLADALQELAGVTRRFAGDVTRRKWDLQTIDRELTLRQTPALRRIAELTAQAASGDGPMAASNPK